MAEVGFDFIDHFLVGLAETVHGLVGENNTPAEGVVGRIAVEGGDVTCRVGLLHQQRKVKAGGAAAKNCNTHGFPSIFSWSLTGW